MSTKKKTIFWVEDDIDIIEPVVQPLRKLGFEFKECSSYTEAIRRIAEIRMADLLLLDLLLPPGGTDVEEESGVVCGLALLRRLRAEYIGIKVIVLSAFAVMDSAVNAELHSLNVSAILSKPIRPSRLKEAVLDILSM